jgi:integrase/recombinase XerD
MLYGTNLGISDIRLLRWQQIDELWQVIRVPIRNGEVRSFVLEHALLAGLKALRSLAANTDLDEADNPYCFPTASGLPMTRQAFCHVVRKWARQCGRVEVVTPSALRRAGRLYQAQRRRLRPVPAAD